MQTLYKNHINLEAFCGTLVLNRNQANRIIFLKDVTFDVGEDTSAQVNLYHYGKFNLPEFFYENILDDFWNADNADFTDICGSH